jgi:uncharacterized membrane protein YfcA
MSVSTVFSQVIALEGLPLLLVAALVAGLVRGFAGFGTAMIFLPVAGQFLSPVAAIAALTVMDFFGPLPIVKRAWNDADRPDLGRLAVGMALTLPIALWALSMIDPQVFRFLVSGLSLGLLVVLGLGVRYRGVVRPAFVYGIGGLGGITGGLVGIPGPPVILFYMASPHSPSVIRANNLLYLLLFDTAILAMLAVYDALTIQAIAIGLFLVPAIVIGNMIGARLFNPEKEKTYRSIAFVIIGISALMGLPFFD